MISIGCCTGSGNYFLVKALGFDAIELPGKEIAAMETEKFRTLEETVRNGELPCCGFNASFPGEIRICGPGYHLKTAQEYMKRLCERGARLGCSGIGVGSPASRTLPDGFPEDTAWEQAGEFLQALAAEAAPYGQKVLWESLNSTETNFGLSMAQGAELVKVLRRDGAENLWLVADLYHMSMVGESPQVLADCLALVRHLHIAQRVGQERRYPSSAYREDYQKLLAPVLTGGYEGMLTTEAFDGEVAREGGAALTLLRQLVSSKMG